MLPVDPRTPITINLCLGSVAAGKCGKPSSPAHYGPTHHPFLTHKSIAGLFTRGRSRGRLVDIVPALLRVVGVLRRLETLLLAAIIPLVVVVLLAVRVRWRGILVLWRSCGILGRRRSVSARVVLLRVLGTGSHPSSAVARGEAPILAPAGVPASALTTVRTGSLGTTNRESENCLP